MQEAVSGLRKSLRVLQRCMNAAYKRNCNEVEGRRKIDCRETEKRMDASR